MAEINKNLIRVLQINQQVKAVTPSYETCGVPYSYNDCPATVGQNQNVYAVGAYQGGNSYQPQVERETKVTKDTMPPTNNGRSKDVQPLVVQIKTLILNSEPVEAPVVAPVAEPVVAPVNDPTSLEVDHSYYDTEGDILLLEAFLNDDPSLPPPNQGMYLPQVRKELKIYEAKNDKSLIDEPPEGELKDLPPHLEYVFLEGNDKFPVIIAKYLSVEEKATVIKVLKSHKQVIA
nr:reverse transcriptase domain-containing protein [Tanacetum cinerariifolium]